MIHQYCFLPPESDTSYIQVRPHPDAVLPICLLLTREKAPIKAIYREFKDLEHRLAQPIADPLVPASDVSDVPATPPVEDTAITLDKVKAEKKRVKQEIQTWLDEFEAREGRPAEQA